MLVECLVAQTEYLLHVVKEEGILNNIQQCFMGGGTTAILLIQQICFLGA